MQAEAIELGRTARNIILRNEEGTTHYHVSIMHLLVPHHTDHSTKLTLASMRELRVIREEWLRWRAMATRRECGFVRANKRHDGKASLREAAYDNESGALRVGMGDGSFMGTRVGQGAERLRYTRCTNHGCILVQACKVKPFRYIDLSSIVYA